MKNILVPIDLSDATQHVVEMASSVARPLGGKLWLVHVAAPDPDFVGFEAGPKYVREHRADVLRREHVELQAMAKELEDKGLVAEALLVQGPTSETILNECERLSADLIIMGSQGHSGLVKALLGSVSEQVLRHSRIPVMIIPPADKA